MLVKIHLKMGQFMGIAMDRMIVSFFNGISLSVATVKVDYKQQAWSGFLRGPHTKNTNAVAEWIKASDSTLGDQGFDKVFRFPQNINDE